MYALWRLPAKRRVQVRGVKEFYPVRECLVQVIQAAPFAQPEEFFLNRAHCPLGIGVSFRVVVAGECLCDAERCAFAYKSCSCWLAAVIAHQAQTLPADTFWEVGLDAHLQGLQPLMAPALVASMMADDLF